MSNTDSLISLRDRLLRIDKYLAKLYKLNAELTKRIEKTQRERQKLVMVIESKEIRCGQR